MSDSLVERLKQFTPDASGMDRDTLLFQAGRASVRPGRSWQAVAAALALCQLMTLALLAPRQLPAPRERPVARLPGPPMDEPASQTLAVLRHQLDEGLARLPGSDDQLVADAPALSVVSSLGTVPLD